MPNNENEFTKGITINSKQIRLLLKIVNNAEYEVCKKLTESSDPEQIELLEKEQRILVDIWVKLVT
jgi:hypothetical protein